MTNEQDATERVRPASVHGRTAGYPLASASAPPAGRLRRFLSVVSFVSVLSDKSGGQPRFSSDRSVFIGQPNDNGRVEYHGDTERSLLRRSSRQAAKAGRRRRRSRRTTRPGYSRQDSHWPPMFTGRRQEGRWALMRTARQSSTADERRCTRIRNGKTRGLQRRRSCSSAVICVNLRPSAVPSCCGIGRGRGSCETNPIRHKPLSNGGIQDLTKRDRN
jgi:hypothetical protein